jgi:glycosyltransferase involved in cell wall biosynthesis
LISAAANWSKSKGWDDYIKLSTILPNDCVIMLLGVTPEQQRSLPTNIIGVQRVEGKSKLAEYYSMGDILLNLSYQETFGMTTAEAMACGTPGISYNVTACPELISPETGLVVEPGNMDQILSAIATIKQNGKHHYSDACRKRVLDNFDFKKVNHRFFEIYDEILKR